MDDDDPFHAACSLSPHSFTASLSAASSIASATPTANASRRDGTPRLGDFSKLHSEPLPTVRSPRPDFREAEDKEHTPTTTHDVQSILSSNRKKSDESDDFKLGNFRKLFHKLDLSRSSSLARPASPVEQPSAAVDKGHSHAVQLTPTRTASKRFRVIEKAVAKGESHVNTDISSESEPLSDPEFDEGQPTTPPITPPSSVERESYSVRMSGKQLSYSAASFSPFGNVHDVLSSSFPQTTAILGYQFVKHGPSHTICGPYHTEEQKHASMSSKLTPYHVSDDTLYANLPAVASHGIHVFLDMSNINISFQVSLRREYNLPDSSRFKPLPSLNLRFLTEILVRGRDTRVLNVGCSVQPGRHEPYYIDQLRKLGYRVDLRERKRIEETKSRSSHWPGLSSSDEMGTPRSVRYVEDLVDETLQTRIGESVMEYFQEKGTLVIATGDAQPAKYSDGFFTYAERALRMGWNVEVVSWRCSLSSYWRNPAWTDQWGKRFRIIELDDFLNDLLV